MTAVRQSIPATALTPPDDNMDRIRALLSDLRASFPADDYEAAVGLGVDGLCMRCKIDEAAPGSMCCADCLPAVHA